MSFNNYKLSEVRIFIPDLKIRKESLKEIKPFIQGHIACSRANIGTQICDPKPPYLTSALSRLHPQHCPN
jgi:hypothetical protein